MTKPIGLAAFIVAATVAAIELAAVATAQARGGGGSNFMNSPGYQRRLQESRGLVTNQSVSPPSAPAVRMAPRRHHRSSRR